MASHRLEDRPSLSNSIAPHHHHHNISHAIPQMRQRNHHHNTSSSFLNQDGSSFDFGELEEAIVLQGVKINNNDQTKQPLFTTVKPAATLEMFPSWPIRFQQQTHRGSSKSGEASTDSGSAVNTISSTRFEPDSPVSKKLETTSEQYKHFQTTTSNPQMDHPSGTSDQQQAAKQNSEKRRRPGSNNSDKILDAKTLRRLAQNREAAKKSRIRKKAYVQQLESSRIRLAQLEQELQRARSQGIFLGAGGIPSGNISSGGAIFDMEYARWLDDDHRHMSDLRAALQAHLSDSDLRIIVENYINHYDEIFRLKGIAAKSDVFHLITGMWKTPAERCFLWMGGFKPSELIKMLMVQLNPLTEHQVMGIYGLQQSSQQAEEALTQGLDQLQQSLIDTIANGFVNDSMHHMAVALGKLANLEGFVRQADNLRQQTLHQLRRILTIRQAVRCFVVMGEYYSRLRALSSLWASRPRESLIGDDNSCQTTTDLQMIQPSSHQNLHFSNF